MGLLQDHLGCRWYTRDVAHIPLISTPLLPANLHVFVRPAFDDREVFWRERSLRTGRCGIALTPTPPLA